MRVYRLLVVFIVLVLTGATASAEIYKWVDDKGVIHFSDTPRADSSEATEEEKESAEAPDAIKRLKVELYVTSWCAYCTKAKQFFRSKGIEFTVYDVEKDKDAARRMLALTSNRAVPFAVINGHEIQGYSEEAYQAALQN